MLESYLIRGILIGLIFGVPAGAIGALTIQRTLRDGFAAGLATGLGSSAADLLYSCVGVFGITLISDFLTKHQRPISLLGGTLIVALGVRIFLQKPQNQEVEHSRMQLPLCFASSFAIAIANPATVLSFLMAFTAFEITGAQSAVQSVQLVGGILLGTLCWWTALAGVTAAFRERINEKIHLVLNRVLGCLMTALGGIVFIRAILQM